ncbi:DUF3347 domain-containing protein [Pedobacter cryotolerans]|uniref:DUF3347 domain-containing protein n=1 Tax=Pedobacter cryotolerans TaxID=2571270 RepID=A0A4U1CAK5_9SPHI|nr:DUF3347 domain-containing protein [Pedobacter cryotolerans]TKC03056.1 DUF3347 domain-containing protein [Pedobacter cryotolerans]
MKKNLVIIALVVISAFAANAQSVVAKREFNNTLKAYFEAKNALAKDNAVQASESVKTLVKNIEEFPVKTLSAPQQTLWKAEAETIKKAALAISTEKAIKAQRNSFWPLSSAMLKLAKEFKLNNADVYVQYCPMAKKSWLNEVEAVQNPFYGSMMYDCGEVTETIAKK